MINVHTHANMRTYHQKIINELSKKPLTPLELSLTMGYAYSGISTRIAELRKMGYEIETRPIESYKYVLVKKPDDISIETSEKIIEWIKDKNRFNTTIDLNKLSTDIDVPLHKIKEGMAKVFSKYRVLQMSPTSVIVRQ